MRYMRWTCSEGKGPFITPPHRTNILIKYCPLRRTHCKEEGYVASMTAAVTRGEPAGTYLGPHHRYLRQLDDIGAYCVEHVLQLVYYGDKSLHVGGVWGNNTNEPAMFVMEPKSFNVPLKPPLRQHPTDWAGSCSPLANSRSVFGNWKKLWKKLQDLTKYRDSWCLRACAFRSLDDGTS